MLFHIYNVRGLKVDYVDAVSEADALKHAKRKYPGAMVARWLTQAEQRQKDYQEECEFWVRCNSR